MGNRDGVIIYARLGGDEFVGIFDVSNDEDIQIIQKKIFDDVLSEIHCSTYHITTHISLGGKYLPKRWNKDWDEWGIEANCYRVWFPRETSIEDAMTRLFSLQVEDAEACKTTTS